jgi:hypothetical protein
VDCGLQAGPCRIGLCEEAEGGCTFTNLDDATDCNADANGCTVGDSCTSGFCLPGTAADCSSYDDVCITGICQSQGPSTYACETAPESAGALCEDGDFCSVSDGCDGSGVCISGDPRDCTTEVGDACNTGWCDEPANACVKSKVTDGTYCDDSQACTLSSGCQNGVCIGADDVCVDERLDVTGTGFNAPAVQSLGYGRYVVQWAGQGTNYARISDGYGSREGEELGAGSVSNTWTSSIAVMPAGTFSLLYGTSSSSCPWAGCGSISCGQSNCTSHETFRATTFGSGGLAQASDSVTVFNTNASGHGCEHWPVVGDARAHSRILPFSDLGMGTILSWHPTFKDKDGDDSGWGGACSINSQNPPYGALRYTPITSDLAAGASVELVPTADTKSAWAFDAAVIPDGTDRFLLAWIAGDGVSVRVQSFLKDGQPDALDPWTIVDGVAGETVYNVRLMAFGDGVFAVLWDAEGADGNGSGVLARRFYPDGSPLSPALQVNLDTQGDQRLGDVGAFSDGSWVAVYDDEYGDTVGWGVKARRFSDDDTPSAEMSINTNEDGDQTRPTVGVLSSDQWVTVFLDDQDRVWTRRFYKDGTPSPGAPERRANGTTQGDQTAPRAAQSDEGTVLVVYESPVPGQEDGEILARAFGVDGLTVGEELQVNTTGAKSQSHPTVAGGPNRFVVAWQSLGEDGSLDGVYARLLDGAGAPLANPFAVNVTTASYQRTPAVAMRPDGQFAVVWSGYNPLPGLQTEVYLRIFDKDAGQLASEMIVNETVAAAQDHPAVAPSPTNQEWVVAWESVGQDGSGSGIYMRKVSSSGALLSDEHLVNETASGEQQRPSVAISEDGLSLAVCWETSDQDVEGTWGVACTILDYATLNATVPEFIVNAYWNGDQRSPRAAFLPSGELLVAWETEEVDGDLRAIQLSRIPADQSAQASRIVANRTWEGDQYAPFVVPLSNSGFWVGWETDNQDGDGTGVTYRVLPPQ